MPQYRFLNGAMPTTAKFVAVTTGTSIKTMLQVKTGTAITAKIKAWGISFDGSAAATPISCELIETGTVFATVTAYSSSDNTDIVKKDPNAPNPATTYVAVGTSASGFTSSAEGTITAVREFDTQLVAPTNQYIYQWPLGDEPIVNAASALRIRVHAGAAVNCVCWVDLEF